MPSQVDCLICIGCGMCAEKCPVEAIVMDGVKPVLDDVACIECGICVTECPAGAREIVEVLPG